MSDYTKLIAVAIFATGTVTGFILALVAPAVTTATILGALTLVLLYLTVRHVQRFP